LPELPGLKYVGAVPHRELPSLLQQCDALVFPSYFEGFALVILEAMASGLPVITTTASGGANVIADENGWIIHPGDLSGLIAAMSACLENRAVAADMGRAARRTAEAFTWHAYGDRWMQILDEVCSNATHGACSPS
jgi:glycosyltransferase involved in cell wall biosynthesis